MAEPSDTRPAHPRRPPAHKSVSLRHSASPGPEIPFTSELLKRQSRISSSNHANPPSSDDSKQPSSTDSKPGTKKQSSGESSNADKWFERSNNEVTANQSSFADNEPPFFLRNSSSSETPPDVAENRLAQFNAQQPTLPHRPSLMHMDTQGSSSEDFRGVIDDLTIENKKLKKKLRKYEKLYDVHLQQEKLFEIRVHDLPAAKKRELEEQLRKFALSLDESPQQSVPTNSMNSGYEGSSPALIPHQTSSSHTSTKFADSAYVSNSASIQHSLAPSPQNRANRKTSNNRQQDIIQQDIQSYLHDIPAVLLPKQPVAMTEKTKRKLVVRRLEQIFAGKGAAIGGHQQPLQQQEVSQSAAHADRMAIEAAGQHAKTEGLREAHIMAKGEPEKSLVVGRVEVEQDQRRTRPDNTTDNSGKDSPNQRPTRPLDLDLHRAQVPKDNIDYIRHLGFSPADPDISDVQDEGHGWVYLNVLTNMAQLHTLNVTTDFVKKSINDYSKKLHLSRDGRKVRWKGGHEVTLASSDGSPGTGEHSPSSKRKEKTSSNKKPSLGQTSSGGSSEYQTKASRASSNKLAYVPMFFHRQESEGDGETSDEHVTSWSSPQLEQAAGNSSGFTNSGIRASSSKRKRGEDGPIIFYNKAKFCTDLSGDRSDNPVPQSSVKYNTVLAEPVGSIDQREIRYENEDGRLRRPLTDTSPDDAIEIEEEEEQSVSESGSGIKFSPTSTTPDRASSTSPIIEFEASGLGGVQPTDNFKIEVQSRRKSAAAQAPPSASHFARNKAYPAKILAILNKAKAVSPSNRASSSGSPAVEQEVISTRQQDLPASALPEPASLFTLDSPEEDSDEDMSDSGAESDVSSLGNNDRLEPSTVPQMLHFSSNSSDEEDSDVDDTSDDSVDLLANARELNPKLVHEREREYDADMADRLAEDIPAGSSAATAGGGSGFNTPASPEILRTSGPERRRNSGAIVPSVKRARTSDDLAAQSGGKNPKLE